MAQPNEWWICEANDTLIQGPGFDYQTLIHQSGDKLLVHSGSDPDHPVEIPLTMLKKYLSRGRNGV